MAGLNESCFTENLSNDDLISSLNDVNGFDSFEATHINESNYFDIDKLIFRMNNMQDHFTVISINMQSIKAKWSLFSALLDVFLNEKFFLCLCHARKLVRF